MLTGKSFSEIVLNMIYLGNCIDENLIDDLFGSVSEFARLSENEDNFQFGNILIEYDDELDIHNFFQIL